MVKKNSNLTAEQKLVMFEDGTEPPGSSELNNEKREGSYHCANCDVKLFESNTKYESGSGWPSFYDSLPEVFETKTDHLLGYGRTEYHCRNCNAHHGHVFDDGPIMVFVSYLRLNNKVLTYTYAIKYRKNFS